jgi:diguanylate cyclase (GGDEF)-like protein
MEFRLYFQILRRGWWIIAITALTALVAALATSYLVTPRYRAVARFIVTPGSGLVNRDEVLTSLATLDRQSIITTYAEVMNSDRIYTDALTFLQLQPRDLKSYTYKAEVVANSSVLEVVASGPDPQLAANLANAIGYQTINFIRQLNQVYNFDFLDIAVPPDEPYSPNLLVNVGLATVLGVIAGALFAVLNEQLRTPLEALRQRLHFDEMTGVYNSKYFTRMVDDELALHPGNVLTIGTVELSGLRDLLETLPIVSLQRILRGVTDILRRELRGNDVVGRWNDHSFIIMLPNTSGTAAKKIFERIYQALEPVVELDQFGTAVDLNPRIGGAEYSSNISTQELFEKANSALEQARRTVDEPVYVWEIKNPFWNQPVFDEN